MWGMNLEKLFETQKVLREIINYQGEDRFNKLVLALLVELGECANEWRGFKFWSKDQQPRTFTLRTRNELGHSWCDSRNPMLEEYVDCLHFILELGIELDKEKEAEKLFNSYLWEEDKTTDEEVIKQFSVLYGYVNLLNDYDYYINVLYAYFRLGEKLRFSWGQVEEAYHDKNKVNHQRQEDGY
jgi:dimeric dUTPase (all-alpha-NTP-PPase superfamily)